MPFKKTSFFPLYVEYVDEIFNPHPHIPHMRIIRIFRIFRIRMASPSTNTSECDAVLRFPRLQRAQVEMFFRHKVLKLFLKASRLWGLCKREVPVRKSFNGLDAKVGSFKPSFFSCPQTALLVTLSLTD